MDRHALEELFNEYDLDKDGVITVNELESMLVKLGVAPLVDPLKKTSMKEEKSETPTA